MFGIHANSAVSDLTLWEKLAGWYQESLLREILVYLRDTYFTVEFGTYENFTVSPTAATTIRTLVPALAIALVIASLMTARVRVNVGRFVRKLLHEECLSPESAKTLMELGVFRDTTIRRELSKGSNLRMVVRCLHEDGSDTAVGYAMKGKGKNATTGAKNTLRVDFLTARFYVPEELKHRADVRFDKHGSGWIQAIATVAIAIAVAVLLCWLLPDVLQLADNIISMTSPTA